MKFLLYTAQYARKNANWQYSIENDRIQENKKKWYEYILHMDPRRTTQQIL
jgi:hypothetical protein